MKKIILIFLFVFSFATALDKTVFLIEAKLYPKIAMLVNDLSQKKELKIAIVSNKKNKNIARLFQKLLNQNNYKADVINKINLKYDVYILTYNLSDKQLQKLLKNKKIIFTIYPNNVKNAMFGIYIGARIYPYINPKLIKEANIKINPVLFKVGKIYEQ